MTYVGTCDMRGHTRHPWAHVTSVGTCDRRGQCRAHVTRTAVHVTSKGTCDMRRLMMSCDNPQKILVEKEVRGVSEIETCVGKEGKVW